MKREGWLVKINKRKKRQDRYFRLVGTTLTWSKLPSVFFHTLLFFISRFALVLFITLVPPHLAWNVRTILSITLFG